MIPITNEYTLKTSRVPPNIPARNALVVAS